MAYQAIQELKRHLKTLCLIALGAIVIFVQGMLAPAIRADEEAVLKAGVSYSVDDARQESFHDLPTDVDPSVYGKRDPNFKDHFEARLDESRYMKDRVLTYFNNGSYAVYRKGAYECFYYTYEGQLFKVGVSNKPRGMNLFPNRDVVYDAKTGKMTSVGLFVARGESFVFHPDGSLIAHWQQNQATDESGSVILTRSLAESPE
jgi:hypothetical protein